MFKTFKNKVSFKVSVHYLRSLKRLYQSVWTLVIFYRNLVIKLPIKKNGHALCIRALKFSKMTISIETKLKNIDVETDIVIIADVQKEREK